MVHFFICTNRRSEDALLPSCGRRGSPELFAAFQAEYAARGFPSGVKISGSTCLTTCQCGPTVVVYPEATWYGGVTPDDVPALVDAHLSGSGPVSRLLIPPDTQVW